MKMAKIESDITQRIRQKASALKGRVFRNNRGLFFTLDKKRKVKAGLEVPGAADLIGWQPITITPGMVGKEIAVICTPEVKKPEVKNHARGGASTEQLNFIENDKSNQMH